MHDAARVCYRPLTTGKAAVQRETAPDAFCTVRQAVINHVKIACGSCVEAVRWFSRSAGEHRGAPGCVVRRHANPLRPTVRVPPRPAQRRPVCSVGVSVSVCKARFMDRAVPHRAAPRRTRSVLRRRARCVWNEQGVAPRRPSHPHPLLQQRHLN